MPTSNIARLYHSVSCVFHVLLAKQVLRLVYRTLLPDGRVMIAGSNPNAEVETRKYKTEYQVEYISPVSYSFIYVSVERSKFGM